MSDINIAKSRNFLLKESIELDEMAKIQGGLKATIEAIIEENPNLDGLALKKVIRADEDVIDLLDGDDLYDNQLNKFIALYKGQRTLQSRGRKPTTKEGDTPINEMAKIAGDLKTSIESVIKTNPSLDGLALKKAIKSDPSVISALGNEVLHDNQLNKFISSIKGGVTSRGSISVAKNDIEDNEPSNIISKGIDLNSDLDDEEIIDTWNEPEEEDEEGTPVVDKSLEKEIPSDVGAANNYKNIIVKKVAKIEALPPQEQASSPDMKALKQFILKPEVNKTLGKETIRNLVSSLIG